MNSIREELLSYQSQMSAAEIIAWNEMNQNPNLTDSDFNSFLTEIKTKYDIINS